MKVTYNDNQEEIMSCFNGKLNEPPLLLTDDELFTVVGGQNDHDCTQHNI